MRAWRQVIEQWATQRSRIAPLTRQHVEYWMWDIPPPSSEPWPPHLPSRPTLQDFYRAVTGDFSTGSSGGRSPNWPSATGSGSNLSRIIIGMDAERCCFQDAM